MLKNERISIKGMFHIAIIKEVDRTIERFWNDLGIGPWQIMSFGAGSTRMTLYGKPVSLTVRGAGTQVGSLMIAVDEPLSRPNPYEEIIDRRGGGAHHLAFVVERLDQSAEEMQRLGYKEIGSVYGIGPSGEGGGSYFDAINNMGTVIEFAQLPSGGMPAPESIFPSPDKAVTPSKIKIQGAVHVAIAVRDAEKAAKHYQEDLGVGPWQILTFGPEIKKVTYRGKVVSLAVKRALTQVGPLTLILEQPLSGVSSLGDFLERSGQGIQRVCFEVERLDQAAKEMKRLGYEELGAVYGFGPKGSSEAICFGTEDNLGILIELAKVKAGL
jgi:catechol 2,3-dioxygenase-like lactoylglutathione lyase family enzyme